jgi:hypothetical protein
MVVKDTVGEDTAVKKEWDHVQGVIRLRIDEREEIVTSFLFLQLIQARIYMAKAISPSSRKRQEEHAQENVHIQHIPEFLVHHPHIAAALMIDRLQDRPLLGDNHFGRTRKMEPHPSDHLQHQGQKHKSHTPTMTKNQIASRMSQQPGTTSPYPAHEKSSSPSSYTKDFHVLSPKKKWPKSSRLTLLSIVLAK